MHGVIEKLHIALDIAIGITLVAAPMLFTSVSVAAEVVTSPAVPQKQRAGDYWTPQRKAAAKPMPLREVVGLPVQLTTPTDIGTPGSVSGSAPGNAPSPVLKDFVPSPQADPVETQPAFGLGSTIWYDYPPPVTLYVPVLDYFIRPIYPHTAIGKLFFSDGPSNYVCSASSITSTGNWGAGNGQNVVTAGHCCSDGAGGYFQNWVFEPAHIKGNAPLGSWVANSATVLNAYHTSGDLSRDVCMLQMQTLNGKDINDAVGALGYSYNQPLPQHYHATGWPAGSPFDGSLLYIASASDAETDTAQAGDYPFTHGIGSGMTGGSSGGAWIRNYQSLVGQNEFNGLNSYTYTSPNRPEEMFGPYIDDVIINTLLQYVATLPAAP